MLKLKKISKCISLISLFLLLLSEFLNLLFQDIIYNYYVDKAIYCDFENEFWNIGKEYKQIGVMFSKVGNCLFWITLFFIVTSIMFYFCDFIRTRKNAGDGDLKERNQNQSGDGNLK